MYGALINDRIYPICDGDGQRVLVRHNTLENILMTPESAVSVGFRNLSWNHTIEQRRMLAAAVRRHRQS